MREDSSRPRVLRRGRLIAAAVAAYALGAGALIAVSEGSAFAKSKLFRFGGVSLLELSPDFRKGLNLPTDISSLGAVSAAAKENGWYSANYVGIIETTRTADGYLHRAIAPPEGLARWNPTGLCAGSRSDELFVANYNGHDVLRVKLAGDGTMSLVRRFTHDSMRSPENVAYHEGVLYVADYDGGAILAFDADSGKRLWRTEVSRAHGVCVAGGLIYATSLLTRDVLKLDMRGRILARAGVSGWRPGEFLWPTQVVALKDGTLAVADAHQGRITILRDDLAPVRCLGGLGAGTNALNFPYCVLVRPEGNYIFDTFKERVLRMDDQWRVVEEISLVPNNGIATATAGVSGVRRNAYCYPKFAARSASSMLGLPGLSRVGLYGGYGGIVQQSIPFWRRITMQLPRDWKEEERSEFADQWYMTWARRHATERGDVLVMGSPQLRRIWVIDAQSGVFVASDDLGATWREDAWRVAALGAGAPLRNEVVSPAAAKLAAVMKRLDTSSLVGSASNAAASFSHNGFAFTLTRTRTGDRYTSDARKQTDGFVSELAEVLSENGDAELSLPRLLTLRQKDSSGVRDIHAIVKCTDDAGGELSKLKDVIVWSDWGVPCAERSLKLKVDEDGAIDRVTLWFSGVVPPGSLTASAIHAGGEESLVSLVPSGERIDVLVGQASSIHIRFLKTAPSLRGFVVLGAGGVLTQTRINRWMGEARADECRDTHKAGAAVRRWAKSSESIERTAELVAVFEKVTGSGGSARIVRHASGGTIGLAYFDDQRAEWKSYGMEDGASPIPDLCTVNDPSVSLSDADLDFLVHPERYR